jgi:hypothetical protein
MYYICMFVGLEHFTYMWNDNGMDENLYNTKARTNFIDI